MPSNFATKINFEEYTWILSVSGTIWMSARLGRDPRSPGNSNRSIIQISSVSDSLLKPVTMRGKFISVNELAIIGDA